MKVIKEILISPKKTFGECLGWNSIDITWGKISNCNLSKEKNPAEADSSKKVIK